MPNNYADFAPVWLARTIFEDSACAELVERFLRQIPTHICSGIYVINKETGSRFAAADRYTSTSIFLASIWTRGQTNFKMTGGNPEVEIDTKSLCPTMPPKVFLDAMEVGEETYARQEKERRSRISYSSPTYEEE
jgi:hypothetical protein